MKGINYIFSINTGRSGSNYLKTIFDHASNCQSFHEPQPVGNGKELRQYLKGYPKPIKKVAQKKSEIIEELNRGGHIYVETNHCFIKGFGWFIPEFLSEEKMGVIILKREEPKIIESMLRIESTHLTKRGRKWLTTPEKKNPLVMPPTILISPRTTYFLANSFMFVFSYAKTFVKTIFQTDLQRPQWLTNYEYQCLKWYIQETAAQADAFKKKFPNVKYYEVNLEDLNSPEQVKKMLSFFGCREKSSLNYVVGKATNLKNRRNKIKDQGFAADARK